MSSSVKKRIRRSLEWLKLQRESFIDANRYYRAASWAGHVPQHQLAHIESDLIKHYHVLEKGLAMGEFRSRAGTDVLERLIELISLWRQHGGETDAFHYLASLAVINAYHHRHQALGIDVSDIIPVGLVKQTDCGFPTAGSKAPLPASPEELAAFDHIALSRHSVRHFDPQRRPDPRSIEDAVQIALSTPSVCNRQTWRIHLYEGTRAQEVLSHQNGNRGFGHLIPTVAVITSDMRLFGGGVERYQAWIEGGMFAMNFLLALHARGLASVALNWSRLNRDVDALLACASIPDHERITMLIGIGHAAAGHQVACSPRSPVDQFITWHS